MLVRIKDIKGDSLSVSIEIWNPDGTMDGRKQEEEVLCTLKIGDMIEVSAGGYYKICPKGQERDILMIEPNKGLHARKNLLLEYIQALDFQHRVFAEVLKKISIEIEHKI